MSANSSNLTQALDIALRDVTRLEEENKRLKKTIHLSQLALKELVNFRCFDGVWQFNRKPSEGYTPGDELAPFLSETFLYNSVGKETARSILGRVRDLARMLKMSDAGYYGEYQYSAEEEIELRLAVEYNSEYWTKERRACRTHDEWNTRWKEHSDYIKSKIINDRKTTAKLFERLDRNASEAEEKAHEKKQNKLRKAVLNVIHEHSKPHRFDP